MKALKYYSALVLIVFTALFNAGLARAQVPSGVELENVAALVAFGEQITFVATLKSSRPIQVASILILDEARGTTHVEPLVVQGDGRTQYRYEARQNGLRPFSPVSWNYRITFQDGSSVHSQVYSTRYDDNRFDWQSLEGDMLRVHWYAEDADFGKAALEAARAGLASVSRLIAVDLSRPVDVYVYANVTDLRGTLVSGSQDWIAGHTDPSLGVVMVAIEPGPGQETTMQQRIPHELMHIMLSRAAGEGSQAMPAWLSEGTAAQAEIVPNMEYERVLQDAVARQDWIPLRQLCGAFPSDSGRAFLAYAESRSFAGYLYERYGSAGLLNLVRAYAGGAGCEDGPQAAFGVSLASLESGWQASVAGQKPEFPALQNITPYLVLLGLILLVPTIGMLSTARRKRNPHEPETYIRK